MRYRTAIPVFLAFYHSVHRVKCQQASNGSHKKTSQLTSIPCYLTDILTVQILPKVKLSAIQISHQCWKFHDLWKITFYDFSNNIPDFYLLWVRTICITPANYLLQVLSDIKNRYIQMWLPKPSMILLKIHATSSANPWKKGSKILLWIVKRSSYF